ncbi:diguanylate cyclase [Alkaliphilus peptidifermentans]|uniref:Diguanylate cyclase (GGDEF) domain-containing protein n=1 Tax=Alkaliphilus peptidifermentans DSM 18978 TaxID=1120976 RepID=A0A1G5CQL3_9FIRM|nr:diguanylate cyclase [Alkaliphilus peptidifermentans]SCY04753.1 diguanylate cyclase (GGDEF) domain-containing protein [Alkaliphilus peptidifermentans DSM 18978]
MELINNRYRIEDIKEQESLYSKYIVQDLLQKNKKVILYIINHTQYSNEFITFCNNNFYELTSIQHPNLLQVYNYGIIETIDDKRINDRRFYYTTEYYDTESLINHNIQLSEEEILNVYTKAALVLDYLHFHGHIYKFIGIDTMFVFRHENDINIKLLDLVSLKKYEINKRYLDEMSISCRAPELTYGIELGSYTDIYSLGALFFYLYTNQEFQYHKLINRMNHFEKTEVNSREYLLFETFKKMTHLDFFERYQSIHELNRHVKEVFRLDGLIEDKSPLEKLNFKTPIIGRDVELKKILDIQEQSHKNLMLIHGDKGIGKTRFVSEVRNQMRWKGYKTFGTTVTSSNENFYKLSAGILKGILKITTSNIIHKYANELIKIIPEIGANKNIIPARPLSEGKEILKLYDRVSNFIIEGTANQPTLIIIDDFQYVDHTVAEFIDYLLKISKLKKAPITVLLSFIKDELTNESIMNYIEQWQRNDYTLETRLSRLTVEETAKVIKHILGWNQEPLNFATRVMKEADGIPAYIEEAMRELFAQKMIIVDYSTKFDGFAWHKTTDDYSQIKITDNIDEAAVKQFETFDQLTKNIVKIISLFNTSVSLEIITAILGEEDDISNHLRRLTQLRILNEKLEDWGYTYGFFRKEFKGYIYNTIDEDLRIELHLSVSTVLEDLYMREGRENKDELIYHLLQSNQREKAIDYCIDAGDRMYDLKIHSQALVFYMRAHSLINESVDKRKLYLLIKIGDVYQNQGKNKEAVEYFTEATKLATVNDVELIIDAKIRIGFIALYRNELIEAEKCFLECIENAEAYGYNEGLLRTAYLLTRVYMFSRRIDKMSEICTKYLDVARELNRDDYIGMFLSQVGVNYSYKGKEVKALSLFKESVVYLEKANKIEDTCRPINNIGVILQDHFQDSKQARDYLEKSLKIAQQYHRVEDVIVTYNNIADSYMIDYEFNKAIEVLNKNVLLALEYEEETIKILSYINLVECYIDICDYKSAYNYLVKTRNEHQAKTGGLYRANFLLVSCRFYFEMGQYKKAKEIINEYFTEFNENESRQYLLMKKLEFMTLSLNKEPMEDKYLFEVIEQYSNTNYVRDHRLILLEAAMYYCDRNQLDLARDLLAKDEVLIEEYNNEYFQILRIFLKAIAKNQDNLISFIEESIIPFVSVNSKELKSKIYKKLAEAYLEKQDYYRAATYYFSVLEIIQLIINRIPDEFKKSYFLREDKYQVNHQLFIMKEVILNKKFNDTNTTLDTDNLEEYINLDDFFDISKFQELFNNPAFYQLALEQYKNLFPIEVENTMDLIESLTNDIDYNLDLSIKLAGKLVLATRGILIGIAEEGYEIITSFGEKIDLKSINYILEKSSTIREGLIVENSFIQPLDGNDDSQKDSRALMVVPIINKNKGVQTIETEQRNFARYEQEKIAGFLYLETDKVFNNFSHDTLKECEELVPLLGIMLNNYYLKISSSIDKLTGTYIRKYFEKVLQDEIEYSKDYEHIFSIIMCDIDHFKSVNDTYGHQRGDLVLTEVGHIIKNNIRSTDYAGRYGGEEFIILLPRASKMDALLVAEKIRTGFSDAKLLGDDVELTISCGIASYPHDGVNKDTIIERADQALYTAKEQGRNQSVVWEDGIRFVNKRVDKLAGIVTGNIVQDQRNVLVLAEAVEIITEDYSIEEKIYTLLGRLIEILEAEDGILFIVKNNEILTQFGRKRFIDEWIKTYSYNNKLIEKVIQTKQGEYLIDWEDVSHIDIFTGAPNWKSVIATPIIFNGELQGIVYLAVSVKEKEFDFSGYNLAKLTSNILGAVITDYNYITE